MNYVLGYYHAMLRALITAIYEQIGVWLNLIDRPRKRQGSV